MCGADRIADDGEVADSAGECQVTAIFNRDVGAKLQPVLGRLIGVIGGQGRADRGGAEGGAAEEGAVRVGRQPEQADQRPCRLTRAHARLLTSQAAARKTMPSARRCLPATSFRSVRNAALSASSISAISRAIGPIRLK